MSQKFLKNRFEILTNNFILIYFFQSMSFDGYLDCDYSKINFLFYLFLFNGHDFISRIKIELKIIIKEKF